MTFFYIYKKPDGTLAIGSVEDTAVVADGGYVSPWSVKFTLSKQGIDIVDVFYSEADALQALAKKVQATMAASEISAMSEKDITGSVSVAKKGTQYDVLKVDNGHYWSSYDYYVVDLSNGTVVCSSSTLAYAKSALADLESGYYDSAHYMSQKDYGATIELPPSAVKQQAQLLNPKKPKEAKQKSPLPSLVSSEQKKGYSLLNMSDGTYGVFVPSTNQYKFGYKTVTGAAKQAAKLMQGSWQFGAMGIDPSDEGVEQLLGAYESRLKDIYEQAAREMAEKQAKAMAKFVAKREKLLAEVASGNMTQAQYDEWLKSQTMTQKWYKDMVDGLSNDLVSADKKAMEMLNGYVPRAYAEGINYGTYEVETGVNVNTGFTLYNESAVARLVSNPEGSLLPDLPDPKVDELKDALWSKTKINSCVTQSILQGESIPSAALRLATVVGMSNRAAMRTARTAIGCAQNQGHLDAYKRAKGMGIEVKKQWMTTSDARARYSHRALDRETVELEEAFSNGLEYPKDPNGPAQEVYNCRCRIRGVLPKHEYDDLPKYTREGVPYEEWKNEHQTKLAAQKEKYQKQLEKLQAQEADLKNQLPENKKYSGIWKNDVTLEDYEAKKGSIQAKEDYYLQQIANAPNTPYGDAKVAEAKKHLLDLHDFQTKGEKYAAAKESVQKQLDAIKEQKQAVTKKLVGAGAHMTYSDERKAAALSWSSQRSADKVLRHYTSDVWRGATQSERSAVYGYTSGSGRYNRPLSGFDGYWGPSNYKGIGNVDLDREGGGEDIRRMTDMLSRSSFNEDIWLRRGCDYDAMESFFGMDFGTLDSLGSDELEALVGTTNRIGGFVSCGTAAEGGTGFGGRCDLRIFLPSGTNAIYAEPFSAYGYGGGRNWDGVSEQSSFGTEFETIIQRGTSFTCTKIERSGYRLSIELEAHPEDGYDLWGQ